MTERKYLPTFADLVDRLSIVLLKSIFISENREAYREEMKLIEYDLDDLLTQREVGTRPLNGEDIRAILTIMLANRTIWQNESEARKGGEGFEHLLRLTHSINGVRNTAKNVLAMGAGERVDLKVDALAAKLPPDLGNWDVWND